MTSRERVRIISISNNPGSPVSSAMVKKVLLVADSIPMPDRQAGMLRFFRLLEILATRYELYFFACRISAQIDECGIGTVAEYDRRLRAVGIDIHYGERAELHRLLRHHAFAIVLFEHYKYAVPYLDDVRTVQPLARIVIDSIDINFERMLSRARVSRKRSDIGEARRVKSAELNAYRRSDVVIAISDQDKRSLERADPRLRVAAIPLILPVPALGASRNGSSCNLLFVGNFEHGANGDAMEWFCRDVLPAIRREIPHARLRIVGNRADRAVAALAAADVEVLGYVPDIAPLYASSDISIAPLTWGGGLKGKVAEAMTYGLPVVATAVAIDGFELTPGQDFILGNTPSEFADGVILLHRDRARYERIRASGWRFVESNYSSRAIRSRVEAVFSSVEASAPGRLALPKRFSRRVANLLDRHVLWRFGR